MADPQAGAPLARHDLLDVRRECWRDACAANSQLQTPLLRAWIDLGRPVIVRRRCPGEDASLLPCAIALPANQPARRIGFLLPASGVTARRLPPALHACVDAAPIVDCVASLVELGRRHGAPPRVFGSVMWQHLTGLSYVTATSDLDLLWPVATLAQAETIAAALARMEAACSRAIDGELVNPGGAGVQWREFHEQPECLVKTIDAVRIMSRSDWIGLAPGPAA